MRIRTIKPEAFTDEDLWDAEQESGLPIFRAYTGLWCQADREGRFEWRPRQLKSAILPYWDGDFGHVLDVLLTRGFLVRYTHLERVYGVIPSFPRHQFINGKEPQSMLPAPPDIGSNPKSSRVGDASTTRDVRVGDAPIPSLPVPVPDPSLPGGAGGAVERPRPRTVLMARRIEMREYVPRPGHWAYAVALRLTQTEHDSALRDLRDKHGGRKHDEAWLDDRFSSFLEQVARSKSTGDRRGPKGYETPADKRTREQLARVDRLRAEEAAAEAGKASAP